MTLQSLRAGLAAAAILAVAVPATAQVVPTNYTITTYRKVAPEKVDEFLAFTKTQTRKLQQARIDAGETTGWALLKLTTPFASSSPYNYALLVWTSTFPDLDPSTATMDAVYAKAGISRAEYTKTQRALSTVVSTQISRVRSRVGATAQVGDYLRVDYHASPADRVGELLELEQNIYAPVYQMIADSGKGLKGWSVSTPVLPTGGEGGFVLWTSQIFRDSASIAGGMGTSPELFQKAHPNVPYASIISKTRSLDQITKIRVYHVLDLIGKPVTK